MLTQTQLLEKSNFIGRIVIILARMKDNQLQLQDKIEIMGHFKALQRSTLPPKDKLDCLFSCLKMDASFTNAIALCNNSALSTEYLTFIQQQLAADDSSCAFFNNQLGEEFYSCFIMENNQVDDGVVQAYLNTIRLILMTDAKYGSTVNRQLLTHTNITNPADIALTLGMKIAALQSAAALQSYFDLLLELYEHNHIGLDEMKAIIRQKNNLDASIVDFVRYNKQKKQIVDNMLQKIQTAEETAAANDVREALSDARIVETFTSIDTVKKVFQRLLRSNLTPREKFNALYKKTPGNLIISIPMALTRFSDADTNLQCYQLMHELLNSGIATHEILSLLTLSSLRGRHSVVRHVMTYQNADVAHKHIDLLDALLQRKEPIGNIVSFLCQLSSDVKFGHEIINRHDNNTLQYYCNFLLRLHQVHGVTIKTVRKLLNNLNSGNDERTQILTNYNFTLTTLKLQRKIKMTFRELKDENKHKAANIPAILTQLKNDERQLIRTQRAILEYSRNMLPKTQNEKFDFYTRLIGLHNQILNFNFLPRVPFSEQTASDLQQPEAAILSAHMKRNEDYKMYTQAINQSLNTIKTNIDEGIRQKTWYKMGIFGWKRGLPKKVIKIQAVLQSNKSALESYTEIMSVLATRSDKKNKSTYRHHTTEAFYRDTQEMLEAIPFGQQLCRNDVVVQEPCKTAITDYVDAMVPCDGQLVSVRFYTTEPPAVPALQASTQLVVHDAQFVGDYPQILPVGVPPEIRNPAFATQTTYATLLSQLNAQPPVVQAGPPQTASIPAVVQTAPPPVIANPWQVPADYYPDNNQIFWSLLPQDAARSKEACSLRHLEGHHTDSTGRQLLPA